MRTSHIVLDQVDIAFDDEHAVGGAGLLLPATLAERLGIGRPPTSWLISPTAPARPTPDASCSPWSTP
jgi:hypothetical protein